MNLLYNEINTLLTGPLHFTNISNQVASEIGITLESGTNKRDKLIVKTNVQNTGNVASLKNGTKNQDKKLNEYISHFIKIINKYKENLENVLRANNKDNLVETYNKVIIRISQKPRTITVKDLITIFEFVGEGLGNEGFDIELKGVRKNPAKKEGGKDRGKNGEGEINGIYKSNDPIELLPGKFFIPVLRFDGELNQSFPTDNRIAETGEVCNIHTFRRKQSLLQVSYEELDQDRKHGCVLITCHEKKGGRYGRKVLLRTLIAQHFPHKTKGYDKIGSYKDPRLKYIDENRDPKDSADNIEWYDHNDTHLEEQRHKAKRGKGKSGYNEENEGLEEAA